MNTSRSACIAPVEPHNWTFICLDMSLNIQHTVLIPLNVVTIACNCLTIVTILSNTKLHSIHNALILSLAISDFLQGVLSLCTNFMYLVFKIPCSRNCENDFSAVEPAWLQGYRFVIALSFTSNYLCLLVIAMQQWLYIFQPFLHDRLVRPRWAAVVIAVCIVLSFLINLDITLVKSNVRSQNEVYGRRIYAVPILHSLESGLLFVIYFHITLIAYRQVRILRRQVASVIQDSNTQQPKSLKIISSIRFLKMFFTSFGVFFACLSPLIYYRVFLGQTPHSVQEWRLAICFETLPAVHYLANFFVFAIQHMELKVAFKKSIRKCLRLEKY